MWQDKAIELWRQNYTWSDIIIQLSAEYPKESFSKDKVRSPIRRLPEYQARQQTEINVVQPHRKVIMINKDGSRESDTIIQGNEQQMSDADFLLTSHGFNPDQWVLVWAKNSVYNVQRKGGMVDTFYSSRITVQPNKGITEKDTLAHFIEKAEKYSPVQPRTVKQSSENILVINIADVHLGQLSWGEETGENYDYKIATARFKELIHDIIAKSPHKQYGKIYFISGNDFFNTDTVTNTTTAGTQQTNDVRHQKMFDKGCDLLIWAVDALRSAFPQSPIETLLVPGNHDTMMSYHAAKVMYAWFKNDKTVTIDISPKLHKGFAYGATALLFTHGQNELKNLEWAYTEFRNLIGSTRCTEIHVGHKHRIKVEEKNGAIIRSNPTPAALDNWSYAQGYGAVAQTISRVYSKTGLDYEIYSRVK